MDDAIFTPSDIDAGDKMDELAKELDSLRAEKARRQMMDYAKEGLRARGMDQGFAPYILGDSEKATAKNMADFEKHFTQALAAELSKRLPKEAPQDFAHTPVSRARRGIKKL